MDAIGRSYSSMRESAIEYFSPGSVVHNPALDFLLQAPQVSRSVQVGGGGSGILTV